MRIAVYVKCNDCGEFEVIPQSARDEIIKEDFEDRIAETIDKKEWVNENYEASDFVGLPEEDLLNLMDEIETEWENECLEKAAEEFDETWEETFLIVQDSDLKE